MNTNDFDIIIHDPDLGPIRVQPEDDDIENRDDKKKSPPCHTVEDNSGED